MSKRPVIFSPASPLDSPVTKALLEGVVAATGIEPMFLNPSYDEGMVAKDVSFAIFPTMRGSAGVTVRAYAAKGHPVIVNDLGYMRRARAFDGFRSGYWQMGLSGLNWLPSFRCPADRIKELSLGKPDHDYRSSKEMPVLIIGQKPDDAQHGMDAATHSRFVLAVARRLYNLRIPAIYRPHPKDETVLSLDALRIENPDIELQLPGEVGIDHALSGIRYIVTWNSTTGVDAMIRGIPVVCWHGAHYAEAADAILTPWSEGAPLRRPHPDDVAFYFERLAYAQWTLAEIASGYPIGFLLAIAAGADSFERAHGYGVLAGSPGRTIGVPSADGALEGGGRDSPVREPTANFSESLGHTMRGWSAKKPPRGGL